MSKYFGTGDGLYSDGQNFRPYRDVPVPAWREVACPACGESLDVDATPDPLEERCRGCDVLLRITGDRVTRVPERPWHPTDRGYEPPRGSK